MKFAIISDTHFGDDTCALVDCDGRNVGPKYGDFKDAVGRENDYLVLAGDIFDFSIASYDKAYRYGKVFFDAVNKDKIAKEFIYIAGNHDADIWHIIQHQKSIINKMINRSLPESFEHSIGGILDDRAESATRGFTLDKIAVRSAGEPHKYGGMYLDKITDPDSIFNFAYPNLYIATDQESVLVTHGQYLEPYWALLGEIAVQVIKDDLKAGTVDVEECMEMNFPLNQLGCTGIGQAGVLTEVARRLELDVKKGNLERIKIYLDRLEQTIGNSLTFGRCKKMIAKYALKRVKKEIIDALGTIKHTRYSDEFIGKQDVQNRFRRFFDHTLQEITAINSRGKFNLKDPEKIIFGHTHQPISWSEANPPAIDITARSVPARLTLHNTGGWLMDSGKFGGAEIFKYETGKGMSSVRIS